MLLLSLLDMHHYVPQNIIGKHLIKANKTSDTLSPIFQKIFLKALKSFALLVADEHLNLSETSRYIHKYLTEIVHVSQG